MLIALIVWGLLACLFAGYRYQKYPSERLYAGVLLLIYGGGLVALFVQFLIRHFGW